MATLSDGGVMIVDLDTGACWQLNRLGHEVWQLFTLGSSLELVVEEMSKRYKITKERLEADLRAIVQDLQSRALLLPVNSK